MIKDTVITATGGVKVNLIYVDKKLRHYLVKECWDKLLDDVEDAVITAKAQPSAPSDKDIKGINIYLNCVDGRVDLWCLERLNFIV